MAEEASLIRVLEGPGAWHAAGVGFLGSPDDAGPTATVEEDALRQKIRDVHCDVVEVADGRRGVLYSEDFRHTGCDPDGGERSGYPEQDCFVMVRAMADRLAACGFPQVFAGRGTGSYGYHEVAAFVPFIGASSTTLRNWAVQWTRAIAGKASAAR